MLGGLGRGWTDGGTRGSWAQVGAEVDVQLGSGEAPEIDGIAGEKGVISEIASAREFTEGIGKAGQLLAVVPGRAAGSLGVVGELVSEGAPEP